MKKIWMPIFLIFAFIGVYFYFRGPSCSGYTCIQFVDKESYRVEELYENTDKAYRAMLRSKTTQIRLESYTNISKQESIDFNKIKIMTMESLYQNSRSPYPGALSNEIECGNEYKPQTESLQGKESITYIRGFLNDRLQYGNCLPTEIKYEGYTALFYCPTQKRWYQFEIISPLKRSANYLGIMKSISCNSK